MDVLALLKSAHDRIDEHLERIELAESRELKIQLVKSLSRELETHFKIEESSLFNFLEGMPRFNETINVLYDEHMEINDQLDDLLHDSDQSRFNDKVEDLIDLLLDHMDSEETAIFPKVEALLSDEELSALSEKILNASLPGRNTIQKAA